ncbi:MAG: glutaredoxin family protein [Actinomycetota bacterium]|nr:glutaredoxin family protein [Actinomycetota bacterium]
MSDRRPKVTLYGRPGCCLCDDARAVLESLQQGFPFALESVDITENDELHRRYLVRIPVIALDGRELYDYEVDARDLRDRLARTSPAGDHGLG